jgi:tetratricopeptide (TPR) repeat protein
MKITKAVFIALAIALVSGGAEAQEAGSLRKYTPEELEAIAAERKARSAANKVSPRISRYTGAALEASDEGQPKDGLALLDKLNPKRLNPVERAMLYQVYVSLHYGAGDLENAVVYMQKVIDEQIFPIAVESRFRFSIAQVRATTRDWKGVIEALDGLARFVEVEAPNALHLRGLSHFQLGEIQKAITYTEQAVDASDPPPEGWLTMLSGLYIQNEDMANATPVLEELLIRYPKKKYWVQLSLIYFARDNFSGSLAVQQVAYLQDYLTEDKELRRLARSYLYADLPYPAARVLSKGIEDGIIEPDAESYELLANSLVAAREYEESLGPLLHAAELADHGNLFARLGQVYLQREKWDSAAENLERALDKGNLKHDGSALLLLGIAYYNDGRVTAARTAFERASKHEKTRPSAEGWITHINNEQRQSETG